MIAIIDYGMGNLYSVTKALEKMGAPTRIVARAAELTGDERALVLPGVGAFGKGMEQLRRRGFVEAIPGFVATGKPFVGICLGLQLLFEQSVEMGEYRGLGLFPGRVVRFSGDLVVPHMGWNQVNPVQAVPLLAGVEPGSYAYFVHSYYALPADPALVWATTSYGVEFASVVGRDNVMGLQFHPEKSQSVGLRILRNLVASLK